MLFIRKLVKCDKYQLFDAFLGLLVNENTRILLAIQPSVILPPEALLLADKAV
jgi:hypothetical protein